MNAKTKPINLQKKISVSKVIGGKPKIAKIVEFFKENTTAAVMPLCRMYGTATGTKEGVSDFGEWRALTGQFRGVNIADGETFDSGVCFLPDVAQDMVLGALNGGAQAVDFAFDIGVVLDEESATGYVYRASPVIQEENNPIARLEEKMAKMLALAAPADEKKDAPKDAPKAEGGKGAKK